MSMKNKIEQYLNTMCEEFEAINVCGNKYLAKPVFVESETLQRNSLNCVVRFNGKNVIVDQKSPTQDTDELGSYPVFYRVLN